MPVISRIWARSALISAGLQPQQETGTRATGQRNWPTHPAVPPGTDDQNSTPARELEPPQPLLRSLDGGQHPCAKIGANRSRRRHKAARPGFDHLTWPFHQAMRCARHDLRCYVLVILVVLLVASAQRDVFERCARHGGNSGSGRNYCPSATSAKDTGLRDLG